MKDDRILYTLAREQNYGLADNSKDAWLSRQSSNDMLSTFERYDKCRGIGSGIPRPWDKVILKTPGIRF